MFFVGIFGIRPKTKTIAVRRGEICPACGALDQFTVLKSYKYFHFFFIPLWRWDIRYFGQTRCCGQIVNLPSEMGKRMERGERVDLSELQVADTVQRCPTCFTAVKDEYNYCPRCGQKLS